MGATEEATWKRARETRDVERQAAFDAKKVAIEMAVERFDKERAAGPLVLPATTHRLECLIDILTHDMVDARRVFNSYMETSWAAFLAAHRVFREEEEEVVASAG